MNERQGIWQERAAKVFLALCGVAVLYWLLSHALWLIMPFLLAFAVAALIRPAAAFAERKWRVPRRVGAVVLLLAVLLLLSVLIGQGCRRLALEIGRLTERLGQGGEQLGAKLDEIMDTLTGLSEHIPFLSRLRQGRPGAEFWTKMDAALASFLAQMLEKWSARIPDLVAAVAKDIPGALLFLLTFLPAAFYACADGDRILSSLLSYLPQGIRERLSGGRRRLTALGGKYIKAYFLLFLLTFVELLIGFSVLRLPYVVLPALLISVIDILPVLGVSTVLIPWGAIELLRGNFAVGTGLLILCGVMLLVRQVIEPRVVGSSLGLHPLATLFSAYVGLGLFGLVGMLAGPAVALGVKAWLGRDRGATAAPPQ